MLTILASIVFSDDPPQFYILPPLPPILWVKVLFVIVMAVTVGGIIVHAWITLHRLQHGTLPTRLEPLDRWWRGLRE